MQVFAGMVELADTQDLGSCAERCTGSTPATRTKIITPTSVGVIFLIQVVEPRGGFCVNKMIR